MAQADVAAPTVNVAFVSYRQAGGPHFAPLTAAFPSDVHVDFAGLQLAADVYDIGNKKERIVEGTRRFAAERGWDGAMVVAAPPEVLNPGLLDDLRAALNIPVTTAMHACVAALRAYHASKVLLLTPFHEQMNALIRAHLEQAGVTALSPRPFGELYEAINLDADGVFNHAVNSLREVGQDVDAIYFQGAVLDPIKVLDRLEAEVQKPVIASNPAMLWYMLSRLGRTYHVEGFGRLLREWPPLPTE